MHIADTPDGDGGHADDFATQVVHAGAEPDPVTGAVVPPIYQVSTFRQDAVGEHRGYEYSRSGNPTRAALERCLAELEGGARGLAFASGMAATDCLLRTCCRPGDHVVLPDDAYGGTFRLVAGVLAAWGVQWTAVGMEDADAVRAAVRPPGPDGRGGTRLVWCETPSNPLLSVADIAALADIAHAHGAVLAVDNTFATPYLQRPLELGADVVVHSTTKYLGGHSDVVGGALVTGRAADAAAGAAGGEALGPALAFQQNASGAVAGPFDAWLVLRGIRTLAVRMERHCASAFAVARMLAAHPRVADVRYPGLPGHPGHKVAATQMRDFGGMVSFRHAGGGGAAVEVCSRTRLFTLAESLGGVESLIEHPARMTHASAADSPLQVPDDLVRLSIGLEAVEDLLDDLARALR